MENKNRDAQKKRSIGCMMHPACKKPTPLIQRLTFWESHTDTWRPRLYGVRGRSVERRTVGTQDFNVAVYIPTQMFPVSGCFNWLTSKCTWTPVTVMCLAMFLNVGRHYNQYIVKNNNNFFFALLCGWPAAGTWRRSTALRQTKNNGSVLCSSCIFMHVVLSRSFHVCCVKPTPINLPCCYWLFFDCF